MTLLLFWQRAKGNECKKTNIFNKPDQHLNFICSDQAPPGNLAAVGWQQTTCNYLYLNCLIICCYVYCLSISFFAQNSAASVRKFKIHLQISCFKHTFAISDDVHNIIIHTRITVQIINNYNPEKFSFTDEDIMGRLDF